MTKAEERAAAALEKMRKSWEGSGKYLVPQLIYKTALTLIHETGDVSKDALIEHFERLAASDDNAGELAMSEVAKHALAQIRGEEPMLL